MSISSSPIQQATGASPTSGVNTSFTVTISTPGAGNSLIALIDSVGLSESVSSISGGGVTWSRATQTGDSGNRNLEIWYGHNSSGSGTTITINLNGNTLLSGHANVSEWSGLNNASPEATNTNTGNSATQTSGSATPSSVNSLVIAAFGSNSAYSAGPTNSFTRMTNTSFSVTGTGATQYLEGAYQVESAAAAYSTGITTGGGIYEACIAAFGGPASVTLPRIIGMTSAVRRASFY